MAIQIKCPKCGNVGEVDDEPMPGQHLLCPFCSEKFSYRVGEQQTQPHCQSELNANSQNVVEGICGSRNRSYDVHSKKLRFKRKSMRNCSTERVIHSSVGGQTNRFSFRNVGWLILAILIVHGVVNTAEKDYNKEGGGISNRGRGIALSKDRKAYINDVIQYRELLEYNGFKESLFLDYSDGVVESYMILLYDRGGDTFTIQQVDETYYGPPSWAPGQIREVIGLRKRIYLHQKKHDLGDDFWTTLFY